MWRFLRPPRTKLSKITTDLGVFLEQPVYDVEPISPAPPVTTIVGHDLTLPGAAAFAGSVVLRRRMNRAGTPATIENGSHVVRHDRAGADDGALADRHARQDRRR